MVLNHVCEKLDFSRVFDKCAKFAFPVGPGDQRSKKTWKNRDLPGLFRNARPFPGCCIKMAEVRMLHMGGPVQWGGGDLSVPRELPWRSTMGRWWVAYVENHGTLWRHSSPEKAWHSGKGLANHGFSQVFLGLWSPGPIGSAKFAHLSKPREKI